MVEGGSPLAEVNDVTKNAVMRLQDCLDAEKENMLLSNVQTQPIKPAGRTKGSNAISKADGNTSGVGGG